MKKNGIYIGGRWVRRPKGTSNPGTWPEFWRSLSTAKRSKLIEEYKARGWGVYDPSIREGPQHEVLKR
eukprot:9430949-Prorocentrum_lima.AAC.1